MNLLLSRLSRRTLTVTGAAAVAMVAFALPASAHTPVLITPSAMLPWTGPLVIDGTDPIGFFGVLPCAGTVRWAQLNLKAGDTLNVAYGIPDLAPEDTLPDNQLPAVAIIAPDFKVTVLEPDLYVSFNNPEFNENYIFLQNYSTIAPVSGTYSIAVIGGGPERFWLATGVESTEFHGILRGSVATESQVDTWYSTPPPTSCHAPDSRRPPLSHGQLTAPFNRAA